MIDPVFFRTCLAVGFSMGTIVSLVNITILAFFRIVGSAGGKE